MMREVSKGMQCLVLLLVHLGIYVDTADLILRGKDSNIVFDERQLTEIVVNASTFRQLLAGLEDIEAIKARLLALETKSTSPTVFPTPSLHPQCLWDFDDSNNYANPIIRKPANLQGIAQGSQSSNVALNGFGRSVFFENTDQSRIDFTNPCTLGSRSTLVVWINLHPDCYNNQILIWAESGGPNSRFFDLLYPSSIYMTGTAVHTNHASNICAANAGRWIHHAIVDDGTEVIVYRDAELIAPTQYSYKSLEGFGLHHFGNRQGHGSNGFHGYMDDLGVFDRALSKDEIQKIVFNGKSGKPLPKL